MMAILQLFVTKEVHWKILLGSSVRVLGLQTVKKNKGLGTNRPKVGTKRLSLGTKRRLGTKRLDTEQRKQQTLRTMQTKLE